VSAGRRANGEGSIYPYRDGMFAAYVWVSAPDRQATTQVRLWRDP